MRCLSVFAAVCLLSSSLTAADWSTRLDAMLAKLPKGGQAGVVVVDAADGSVLYERGGAEPLALASTTKTLVGAAALLELGPSYQFQTKLAGMGPLAADGTLPGLVVIGSGDPTIDEHFAPNRDPEAILEAWAESLRAKGVCRIVGDIVIDGSLFSGPIRPSTYPTDGTNVIEWFSAPASAFAMNDNCIEAKVTPGPLGDPGSVVTRPASPRITIQNTTRSNPGAKTTVIINRDRDSNTLFISGQSGKALGWLKPVSIHDDPDLLAGDHLKRVLIASGILVSGSVKRGVAPAGAPVLVERRQPLVPAVEIMLKRSQNFYGEQILRLISRARGGDGSITSGTKAVMDVLRQHLGGSAPKATILDGSGLSYGNEASALDMAYFLNAMLKTPVGSTFRLSLKDDNIPGVPGVTAKVKTGTVAISRALVGYLDCGRKRWVFAVLLNRGTSPGIGWAVGLRDKVMVEIAKGMR